MNRPLLQISLASVGFGFLGIFARFAFAEGLSVGEVLTFRFTLASLLLGIYFLLFEPARLQLPRRQLIISALQGLLGYAVFSTLYFKAIEGISVALAAMLLFTYPLWISVIHYIFGDRLSKREIIHLVLAFAGLLTLLWGQIEVKSLMALMCGIGAGLTYAIYIFISGHLQKQVDALASSFYVILFAAMGLFVFHHPDFHMIKNLTPTSALSLLGLALVCTIGPLTLVLLSLQKLPSHLVALVSMIEPLTAAVAGYLILNEHLTWNQILGGVLLLAVLASRVLSKNR